MHLLTDELIEKIIDEIETRPALYDRGNKGYMDSALRKKLWTEVCQAVLVEWNTLTKHQKSDAEREIEKKWRSLRSCFSRELRQQKMVQTGQPAFKKRKYIYFDRLLFLLPHTHQNQTTSKFIEEEEDEDNEVDPTDDLSEPLLLQQHKQVDPAMKQALFSLPRTHRNQTVSKLTEKGGEEDNVVDVKDNIPEQLLVQQHVQVARNKQVDSRESNKKTANSSFENDVLSILSQKQQEVVDEDITFATSLIPFLKRIENGTHKIDARIEILQVLKKYTSTPSSASS